MNKEFDPLEYQLSNLRPARLPAPARQRILHEMQRPVTGHGAIVRCWGIALVFRSLWRAHCHSQWSWACTGCPGPRALRRTPISRRSQPATRCCHRWLFLEARLTAVSPIGANAVAALCSPPTLTNVQIQR